MKKQQQRIASMRGLNSIWALVVVWLVTILAPAIASACSVCTAGRDEENQLAFLLSTLFMSLLPLVVIGTMVFVLWRRIRKLESEESAPHAPGAAVVPPSHP
jgi:heme/copper-type cytochrome/quinol oxidase subunit 2